MGAGVIRERAINAIGNAGSYGDATWTCLRGIVRIAGEGVYMADVGVRRLF